MAAIAAAAIGVGGSLIGGLMGGSDKPPDPPDWPWLKHWSPQMMDKLRKTGYEYMDNPYGLGTSKAHLSNVARATATSGYDAARRNISANLAGAGLSNAGGTSARQEYYAGREMGERLNQRLSEVEIMDFQAKEEQRNRGQNLLMALQNKSVVYSQLASQNYWNMLNMENERSMAIGQGLGGLADAWTQNQYANKTTTYDPTASGYGGYSGSGYSGSGYSNNYGASAPRPMDSGYEYEGYF